MENLYDSLLKYQESDVYPFHMPGHKRKKMDFVNPFLIDITEIHGYDNLHHAEGIIKMAQERAAAVYQAEETHFLVNGSTCGILSAVSACTSEKGKLLMARNCHKAAYHAVMLRGLEAVYLQPEKENTFGINGGILPETVEKALRKNKDIQAVMITSPTYDGVVSDVKRIAELVHRRGIPLIVDEAHGAHFGFHSYFPENSVRLGADIVIHSLHKTLPSFTQTALLHVNNCLVDREKLRMYLGIYQSSSPSYVFMAGIEQCICLIQKEGTVLFENFREKLDNFYGTTKEFSNIRLAGPQMIGTSGIKDFDRSKLVISVKDTDMDGNCLDNLLREKYRLEMEMAAGTYALALTSIADTEEGFVRLAAALREIDAGLDRKKPERGCGKGWRAEDTVTENEIVYRVSEALERKGEKIPLERAEGRVSREFLYLYPPGIPLLVPGERISRDLLKKVEVFRERKYFIQGLADHSVKSIDVILEESQRIV